MYILTLGHLLERSGPMGQWAVDRSLRILEASGARAHPPVLNRLFDYRNTDFEHDLPSVDDLERAIDTYTKVFDFGPPFGPNARVGQSIPHTPPFGAVRRSRSCARKGARSARGGM